jgi:hypothetical protein
MQPNTSWTPWGVVRILVTVVGIGAAIGIGFGLLALIPSSGVGLGDGLDDQMCVTTSADDIAFLDDSQFGKASSSGVKALPTETMHCKPYDSFDHPYAAQALAQVGGTPLAIAVLILALMFRRIINQTWEHGPFHPETTRRLSRFRWIVAGAVGAALLIDWVVQGVKLQLLTDDPWPGLAFVRTTALVWVAAALVTLLCEFGARQRQDAWQQGLNAQPGGEGPV